jgi:hypothetical protein
VTPSRSAPAPPTRPRPRNAAAAGATGRVRDGKSSHRGSAESGTIDRRAAAGEDSAGLDPPSPPRGEGGKGEREEARRVRLAGGK